MRCDAVSAKHGSASGAIHSPINQQSHAANSTATGGAVGGFVRVGELDFGTGAFGHEPSVDSAASVAGEEESLRSEEKEGKV